MRFITNSQDKQYLAIYLSQDKYQSICFYSNDIFRYWMKNYLIYVFKFFFIQIRSYPGRG